MRAERVSGHGPLALGTVVLAAALCLTGCTSSDGSGSDAPTSSAPTPALASATSGALHLDDAWVLAGGMSGGMSGMSGMSGATEAAYGVIGNDGDRPDALVSAGVSESGSPGRSPGSSQGSSQGTVTLHGTRSSGGGTSGTMISVPRIVVPAHGSATLAPGGFHLMIGDLRPLPSPGDRVELTLHFASGTVLRADVPVLSAEDRPS